MAVLQEPNPTAARRELALYFRNLREQRKLSLDDLASYLDVSEAQASRLDRGARGLAPGVVKKLAEWYALPDSERERLLELANESRKRSWWQQVDLREAYRTLIGIEQAADSIREYAHEVVPGLLQTQDYARAATKGSAPELTPGKINLAVEVRMRRQQILERDPAPQLAVVLDEAVLARITGGPAVMRRQLEHLIATGDRPGISVQVIGFEYGTHPGRSHFILLGTGGELPDFVYVETLERSSSAKGDDIRRYRQTWEYLTARALSPVDSRARIMQYVEKLTP